MTKIERIFSKVKYSDDCWEWQGSRNPQGYGVLWNGEKNVRAHRWFFEYLRDTKLGKLQCCHHCDNTSCVNPFHLFAGTSKDNAMDMVNKKRQNNSRKLYCKHGHRYTEANTYYFPSGRRNCRKCRSAHQKASLALQKINQPEGNSDENTKGT